MNARVLGIVAAVVLACAGSAAGGSRADFAVVIDKASSKEVTTLQSTIDLTVHTDPAQPGGGYEVVATDKTGKKLLTHGFLDGNGRGQISLAVSGRDFAEGDFKVTITVSNKQTTATASATVNVTFQRPETRILTTGPFAGSMLYIDHLENPDGTFTALVRADDNDRTKANGKIAVNTTCKHFHFTGTIDGKRPAGACGWSVADRATDALAVASVAITFEEQIVSYLDRNHPDLGTSRRELATATRNLRKLRDQIDGFEKDKKLSKTLADALRAKLDAALKADKDAFDLVVRLIKRQAEPGDLPHAVGIVEKAIEDKRDVVRALAQAHLVDKEDPGKATCKYLFGNGKGACLFRFHIGALHMTYLSPPDPYTGERPKWTFDVDFADACGPDPKSAVWTTQQHASHASDTIFHIRASFTATNPSQIYSGTMPRGAISILLKLSLGSPATIALVADPTPGVDVTIDPPRAAVTFTQVAAC